MPIRTARDMGARVRTLRTQAGLSQAELAGRVGVSRQWLIDFEHGKDTVELGLALATLRSLGAELRIDLDPPSKGPKPVDQRYDGLAIGDQEAVIARASRKAGEQR